MGLLMLNYHPEDEVAYRSCPACLTHFFPLCPMPLGRVFHPNSSYTFPTAFPTSFNLLTHIHPRAATISYYVNSFQMA